MPTPTPVGQRLAYDDPNVAQVFLRSDRNYGTFGYDWVEANQDGLRAMNSDPLELNAAVIPRSFVNPSVDPRWIYIHFSQRMVLRGYSVISYVPNYGSWGTGDTRASLWWSPNTTNGEDGDWFLLQDPIPPVNPTDPSVPFTTYKSVNYLTPSNPNPGAVEDVRRDYSPYASSIRDNLQMREVRDVLGLRLVVSGGSYSYAGSGAVASAVVGLYLYGDVQENGEDALDFWHPYRGEMLPPGYLDWGDVQVSSSEDKAFRLRNRSDTLTVYDVVVSAESDFRLAPFPEDQFLFSFDQETWTPTITVAAMSPGTTSARIHVRRVTPANQAQKYTTVRFRTDAGRWV